MSEMSFVLFMLIINLIYIFLTDKNKYICNTEQGKYSYFRVKVPVHDFFIKLN